MTFKHKLSKRLAMLHEMAVASLAALAVACTPGDRALSPVQADGTSPPSGTLLFQETFEDNAFAARGWYDNTSMVTTTAQHLPGGLSAAELHFTAGATTPVAGGAARHLFPATPTLYVSYWVKYSSNWVGSGHPYHPHEFLVMSDLDGDWDGPSNNWLTAYIEDNYQNGGIPRLALQDNKAINTSLGVPPVNLVSLTENRSVAGCNGVVEPSVVTTCFNMPPWYNDKELSAPQVFFQPAPGPGYKGDWNHVEVYLQINSVVGGVGVADGVMQYWFNGALAVDRHDVLFRTGARPNINFHQFLIAPYIGDGSPVDQYMWIDDLTVATGRLASPSAAVASVTLSPASASVAAGGATQFTATLQDSAGNVLTGRPVTWTSSDSTIATINGSGLATAVAAGTATITATSSGVTGAAPLTVTATNPASVASVVVSPTSTSLFVGNTLQLAAALKDAGGNALAGRTVTWTSSTPAVATVNANGLVTAVAAGSASITATSEGVKGTATVTVTAATKPGKVTDLAVSAVSDTSVTLTFMEVSSGTGQPASYDVRWRKGTFNWSSAADVARGSCKVVLAGTAIGAKRSCTVLGLARGTAYGFEVVAFRGTLNVNAVFGAVSNLAKGTTTAGVVAPVATVTLTPASANLATGATQQFAATLKDAAGNVLTGRTVTWVSSAPAVATVSGTGLVTAVAAGSTTITATSEGKSGPAAMTVTPTVTNPGTVSDLAVTGVTDTSVTLAFTEVSDGAGLPASYDMRWAAGTIAFGTATDVTKGSCAVPVAGSAIGAKRTCTVLGLLPGAAYQLQLVAFRGTLNVNAVFGGLSNVASGTTTASASPPPPPPPTGGGVVFQSDWSTVGTAYADVTDGGRWMNYWEFNGGAPVQLISVVSGSSVNAPGGGNALKVVQRGSSPGYAANVQQDNVVPPSTDYYVRFYMRNDDTSSAGDHIVTVDTYQYANLTYVRKTASATTWQLTSSFYGCGYTYPIGHWTLAQPLVNGAWYRFEYFVHFVDATHVQVHPRIYDAAGVQIGGDADFQQSNYKMSGNLSFGGRDDWTLALFYAAGYSFCVNPTYMTSFGMGNNGQNGSVDTGLAWYYAGVQIRTDRWPGP